MELVLFWTFDHLMEECGAGDLPATCAVKRSSVLLVDLIYLSFFHLEFIL